LRDLQVGLSCKAEYAQSPVIQQQVVFHRFAPLPRALLPSCHFIRDSLSAFATWSLTHQPAFVVNPKHLLPQSSLASPTIEKWCCDRPIHTHSLSLHELPAVPSRPSATARPNGSKGLGTLGGRDRISHELGRERNRERGDRKLEKDAERRGRSRGGKGSIYGESSEARAPALSPIGRPLNPGGQTSVLR